MGEEEPGLELAIVPGELWAMNRTGIPEHLPEAIKNQIRAKLTNEVILRPSPQEEERLRVAALAKEKAEKTNSAEYTASVVAKAEAAIPALEKIASRMPSVQRRRRERQRAANAQAKAAAEAAAAAAGESGDAAAAAAPPAAALVVVEPIRLVDFDPPGASDAAAAKAWQTQRQAAVKLAAAQRALAANPMAIHNPVLGMMAGAAAVQALVSCSPAVAAKYTALGKTAGNELKARRKAEEKAAKAEAKRTKAAAKEERRAARAAAAAAAGGDGSAGAALSSSDSSSSEEEEEEDEEDRHGGAGDGRSESSRRRHKRHKKDKKEKKEKKESRSRRRDLSSSRDRYYDDDRDRGGRSHGRSRDRSSDRDRGGYSSYGRDRGGGGYDRGGSGRYRR
jgi:uncharacterized membrane protein YgcG